jgi:hypothetical protein
MRVVLEGMSRLSELQAGAPFDVRALALMAALAPPVAAQYTLRDSTDTACTAPVGPPIPGIPGAPPGPPVIEPHNIWDTDDTRTTLVKIKNSGRPGVDCPFVVQLLDAAGAELGSAGLEPGQSTSLERKRVKTVRILCAPAAAPARCKANYTLVVSAPPRYL